MAKALTPKQRQWIITISGVTILFGLVWLLLSLNAADPPKKPLPQPGPGATTAATKLIQAPGAAVDPKDAWFGTAGKDVSALKDRLEELSKAVEANRTDTSKKLADLTGKVEKPAETPLPTPLATPVVPPPPIKYPPANSLPGAPPAPRESPELTGLVSPSPAIVRLSELRSDAGSTPTTGAASPPAAVTAPSATPDAKKRTLSNFLPIGFIRAELLGGVDAPTGGQAQANPHPVLLRLASTAFLPNRMRSDVRECFVVAAAYGDISSERAYFRTEKLSCVRQDGGVLETKIDGTLYGEDGKVGMRGRLVTKQGQLLANALLAGVLSGIGQGLQTRSSTTSTSALGSTTSVNEGQEFQAGVGAGIGRAMDRLAQYYISVAEKTFPIIEVDAGRVVDVVVTSGSPIDAGDLPSSVKSPPSTSSKE